VCQWDATISQNFHQAGFLSFEVSQIPAVEEDPIESPTSPALPLAEDQALDGPPEREETAGACCKSEMEEPENAGLEVAQTDPYMDPYGFEDVVIIVSDDEDSGAEELEIAIQESLRICAMEEPTPVPSVTEQSQQEDSGAAELGTAIEESFRTCPMEEATPVPSVAEQSQQEEPTPVPSVAEQSQQEEATPVPSVAGQSQQEELPPGPSVAEQSQQAALSPGRPSRPVLRLDARAKAAPKAVPSTSQESPMRTRSTSSSTSRPDPLEVDPEAIWRSLGETALQRHGWRRIPSTRFPGRSEFVHESGAMKTDSGKEDRQLQTAIAASLRAGARPKAAPSTPPRTSQAAEAARESPEEDAELDRAIAMSLASHEQEEQHRNLAGPSSTRQESQASSSQSQSSSRCPEASDALVANLIDMGFEAEDASQALLASANDLELALTRLLALV